MFGPEKPLNTISAFSIQNDLTFKISQRRSASQLEGEGECVCVYVFAKQQIKDPFRALIFARLPDHTVKIF
jgi:hypothetical protein